MIVPFDAGLRQLTEDTVKAFGALVAQGRTPAPVWRAERCRACSLIELCRPKAMMKSALRFRNQPPGRPMKKLLNTLYVTTEGAGLRKDGENLVAEIDDTERARAVSHAGARIETPASS